MNKYWLCLLFFFSLSVRAQISGTGTCSYSDEDLAIFNKYLAAMEEKKSMPEGELMVETARFFLGTPYVASTLEQEPERLVINFREMDCMTFVENVLALTRTVQDTDPSFEAFCRNLQQLRYRNGEITDYTDRLHYTSDWIYENERKGIVKDITKEIGGEPFPVDLYFMSTHPDSYRQLKANPGFVEKIAAKEKEINERSYYFLPETVINEHAAGIRNGDVVCFATTVKGLDISHVGVICNVDGSLTFVHASTSKKEVIVNPEPLQEYVEGIKRNCY